MKQEQTKVKFKIGILGRAEARAALEFHCGEYHEHKGLLSSWFVASVPSGKEKALLRALNKIGASK